MFASRITKVVALPSDPAVSVTIRKLSALQIRAAQTAMRIESARNLKDMGGAEFAAAMKALRADEPAVEAATTRDALDSHDLLTVLLSGVRSWTAPEPVTAETLADLDDAEWLARQILDMSVPPARSEADEKNAGSASSAP